MVLRRKQCSVFLFRPNIICHDLLTIKSDQLTNIRKMFRQTEPIVRSLTRKRKNIESTPPITDYFTTIKRDRSQTEAKKDVSQKLDGRNSSDVITSFKF